MFNSNVRIIFVEKSSGYEIQIGHDLLADCGEWAKNCFEGKTGKIALVSNPKVFALYGEKIRRSFAKSGFEVTVCLMKDGEKHKNFRTLQETLKCFSENHLTRTDAVVALGGGVVGDLAGFAASVYMRGIAFLQIPTTLLAMIDSSVGGKTAVNSEFGKNLIGAFYQPSGVLIDVETLATLPRRELTAGFCEAIKQGAISGRELFDQISGFLEKYPVKDITRSFSDENFLAELESLLSAQVSFKAKIVQGDEKEAVGKTDAKSRKILNFGHTLAHSLEKVTNYRHFKHGEAVGYGVIFAAELSKKLGLLHQNEVNLLNDVVHRAGKLPAISLIDPELVFETFKYDKKMVNDSLQWILLKGIGKPVIFPHKDIPKSVLMNTLKQISGK